MKPIKLAFAFAITLTACGSDGTDETGDNTTPDATASANCAAGDDRFVLAGSVAVESSSVAPVWSDSKVIGVNGAMPSAELFAFTTRSFADHLDAVGTHDVANVNLRYLAIPSGADCSTPSGGCRGFFALGGTYTVVEVQPRYRATFELTHLRERVDDSDQPGAAIVGTITGCIDTAR